MDLENETSAIESVEDNDLDTASYSDYSCKVKVKTTNGSCSNEIHNNNNTIVDGDTLLEQGRNSENSQRSRSQSPSVGSPPVPKGYGLRKWRRIKRDFVKDASPNEDNSKALKRVLSMSGNPNKATTIMAADMKPNNMGVADGLLIYGTGAESRFAVGSPLTPESVDSENSEDRSSKSSTAASAPRLRYDLPAGLGYNRIKNLSAKGASSSTQRVQQGKGRVESSKKHRGERIKIEKENSHSSIESDSRSSNFFFTQGAPSVTSNGNRNQRSMYYNGENSNEAHVGEHQDDGEAGDGSQDELAADASWEGKEDKSQNHRPSLDEDPLVESIVGLQSVQEALESEVQKFREIVRVSSNPVDSIFLDREVHESSSSEQFEAENVRQSSESESQVLNLTENVKYLESRLEETEAMVKVKDSRITELENTLISGNSAREESGNTAEVVQDRPNEIKNELEQIFMQKMEAEIEYLTLSRTMQKLRVGAGDQMSLFEQQEALAGEQTEMMNKLGEAEKKAEMLEKKTETVERFRGEILETEEVLKMQRKVNKVSWCFLIQLVLLFLVLFLVVQQSSPHTGVVPT